MSKQILNIVFPPPSALFKNPCGFSPSPSPLRAGRRVEGRESHRPAVGCKVKAGTGDYDYRMCGGG